MKLKTSNSLCLSSFPGITTTNMSFFLFFFWNKKKLVFCKISRKSHFEDKFIKQTWIPFFPKV